MKHYPFLLIPLLFLQRNTVAQERTHPLSLGIYSGIINYEGDLKPNSFTFKNSNVYVSLFARLPLSNRISWRAGAGIGKVEADDKDNRDYLQVRNLNFKSSIKEFYSGFEVAALDISKTKFTPYLFLGAAVFHFNPYTHYSNQKVYLQPLGTEGQGLTDYPDRKPYKLTQLALTWAGGMRYALNDNVAVALEFTQRKTFTDYLDDVSSSYVDYNKLLAARGQLAVDIAYRGDELTGGSPYPHDGEQRGTPTEKDWYYMLGLSLEIKNGLKTLFGGSKDFYSKKCPSRF